MKSISIFRTGVALAALALPLGTAAAQDAQPQEPETFGEIVVTAQRRAQSLQDVGISVAAFGGEELKSMGVESSLEIARLTPGVHISGNVGGQNSQFTIRGVTQNDFNDAIEAPVAVYVDDGYIPNLQGQTFGLFDLERVEVLKGPQGTLFGRNATGGLVHYVINKPSDTLEGSIDGTYGRFNQVRVEAAIGGPLSETVSARVSVFYNRHDEIWKNIYPAGAAEGAPLNLGQEVSPCCEDEWNDDTLAGRAQLQFKSDRLTVRLVGAAARQHLSTGPYTQAATVPVVDELGRVINAIYAGPNETRVGIDHNGDNYTAFAGAPAARLPGADWFGFIAPDPSKRLVSKDFAQSDLNRTESWNGALHLDYEFDGATLVSISDYKKFTKNFSMDVEASPLSLVEYGTKADTRSFTQEIRLTGSSDTLDWTVGAYYLDIDAKSSNGFLAPAYSIYSSLLGATETGIDLVNTFRLKTQSGSIFGQVEYKFAPQWTFIIGGRLIREHQEYDFASNGVVDEDPYRIDTGTILFPLQPSFADKRTKTLWAGKAQIEFRPNDDLLLYAGINRGVKGGSYNAKLPDGTPPLDPSEIPYKPEVLLSYEGGFKSTLMDGRATFNGSVYYYDYSNYQAFTFSNVSGFVQNRDGRTYGAEADIALRPTPGLEIGLAASVFNARVKNVQIAPGVFETVRPTFAPQTQISGRISYELPTDVFGGALTIGVDGNYSSSFYHNIRNFDANKIDGYALFNARVSWMDASEAYRISAFVNNFTNKTYKTVGYDLSTLCGCTEESYGRPRWWGLSMGYSFR
ncbi:MAG: TonB-dependent receptor [Sphingosinicella sp.]|nr:TonB-dependent receptor [Sphingosinicella sp.]